MRKECVLGIVVTLIISISGCLGNSDDHENIPPVEQHYCYWDYALNETDHLDTYYFPKEENKFVVVTLKVVNNDTEPFETNPFYWSLVVNHISYDPSYYTWAAKEIGYQSVAVNYLGTHTWKIVFEIPEKNTVLGAIEMVYGTWGGPTMQYNPYLL